MRPVRQRQAVAPFSMEPLEQRALLNAVNIIPSVEGVTASSVYVSLETTDTATATVDFGLTNSYGSAATTETAQSTGSSYFQNIKLTGLAANTQYHYRVRQGTSTTADYTFWTAPATDYTGSVRWAFTADSRTNTTDHNNVVANILPYNPHLMVYGGDLPDSGTYAAWTSQWLVANQRSLNAVSPWVNAPGNHEGWNATTVAFTQSPEGDGVGGNGYFSFNYGPAHIVVINVQTAYGVGSAQWNWVAADLSSPATQAQPWKIVVAHYPPYTYGGSHSSDPGMQAMTTQLFEPNHVDMTLTGHNHFYQHNRVNGIEHMVIGSFGAPLVAPANDPTNTVYSEQTYCFGIFDMTRGQLTLKTYRGLQNTLIETITLTKDSTAPTTPGALTPTPVSYTQIRLDWSASSDPETGVDHYNIYRDGGLLTTVAGGVTTFTDSGLAYSSSHSYQVSAVNGIALESVKAGPVTGTPLIDVTAPTVPGSLTATPLSTTQIRLDWSAASDAQTGVTNYKVYRNGSLLTTLPATQLTFTDSGLNDNTGYSYQVSAVNGAALEGAKAGPIVGTTLTDTTAPTVASGAWLWENYAKVVFSEPVEAASAQNAANYALTCANQYVKVLSAVLQSDNCTVLLTTTDMDTARTYNVVVNNVPDRATVPNTVAANTTAALAYGGFFGQDIGTAAVAGSQSYAAGVYSISASGAGLAGTADGFYYAYRQLPVDGEIVVRVDSMPATATARAGIMVRSSLAAGSPYVGLFLDGTGAHARFQYRTTTGGATTSATTNGPAAPYYLKLFVSSDESGQSISAYIKSVGGSWLPWLTATLPATTDPYYIGLAATTASAAAGAFGFSAVQVKAYFPLPDTAPAGAGDSYTTPWNAALTVPAAAGVLANDTDSDGNSLSAAVSVNAAHGTLSLAGNGGFTYTPAPGYSGPDSFVYTLDDGHGLTQTATANLTIADTVAPVVTVTARATNDATPSLTGTVDDPAATVGVTVGGHTYAAVNNGNGTWTLADNVISPALARGAYDVQARATDVYGNVGSDATTGELNVYTVIGDANLDGQVGPEDFGLLKDNFGTTGLVNAWRLGDFNGDGQVGPEDFGLLKDNFGTTEPPPGPLMAADNESPPADEPDLWDALQSIVTPLEVQVPAWA